MAEQNKDQIDQYLQKIRKCVENYSDDQQPLLLNYALKCKQVASDYFINSQLTLIISEMQKLRPQQNQNTQQNVLQQQIQTQQYNQTTKPVQQIPLAANTTIGNTNTQVPQQQEKLTVKDLIKSKINQSQLNNGVTPSRANNTQYNNAYASYAPYTQPTTKIIQQNEAFIKDAEDQILKIYQGQKQTEINELNSKIQTLQEQQKSLQDQVQLKDQLINQFQIKLDQKVQENSMLLQQIDKLQKQVEQIQGQFYNVSQMCQELQEQVFKQQEQNNQLRAENSVMGSQQGAQQVQMQQKQMEMTGSPVQNTQTYQQLPQYQQYQQQNQQNNNCVQIINIVTSLLQNSQFDNLTKQVIDEAVQSLTQIQEVKEVMLQTINLNEKTIRQEINQVSFQSAAQKFLQITQFVKDLDLDVKNQESIQLFGQTVQSYVAQIALNVLINLI